MAMLVGAAYVFVYIGKDIYLSLHRHDVWSRSVRQCQRRLVLYQALLSLTLLLGGDFLRL
jgi:hypothetical protein